MCQLPLTILNPHRPEDAVMLSAVLAHPDGCHWLADHYIDIYIHKDYINEPWDGFWDSDKFFACPFLMFNSMSSSTLVNMKICLTDFVVGMLRQGYYIFGSLNQSFIPRFSDNPIRSSHGTVIYGYDMETQSFLLADFIDGKYQKYTCDRFSLENAISYCNTDFLDNYDPYIGIELLNKHLGTLNFVKVNNNVRYMFNKELLVETLENYLNGKRPQGIDYVPYGRNTYQFNWGITLIDKCKEVIQEVNHFNVKPFYLLEEHKRLMSQRLLYMHEHKVLPNVDKSLEINQELTQIYTKLYMLVIKYRLSSWSLSRCNNLLTLLDRAKELELRNTERILSQLIG